jgi:hypothetical protein
MNVSSNIDLPLRVVERLVRDLAGGFLQAPVFERAGVAMALETGGPEDGVGVSAYAYDSRGCWQCVDLAEPGDGMEALETWVALSYPAIGPWRECLIQVVWPNGEPSAHFEFEFDEDANRWVYADETDRFLGDMIRPAALPIPLEPGPHF